MTKILGLDISSVNTGYCIINNGRLVKSSIGTISPNPRKPMGERLTYFAKELASLITKHNPDHIVIEDIFRGPNIKTFKTLAMFRGVCLQVAFVIANKLPLSIMPTEARKLVGIGKTKEDAFEFVVNKYNFATYEFDSHNDVTDSIVLALAGHFFYKTGMTEKDLVAKKRKRKRRKKK